MSVELEALIANLYIVGGRAISAAPPGALMQRAPRRSPRARAQDTFFALLDISGKARAPAPLYEQLVRVAADSYFRAKGTMTSGLREAIEAVNEALMAHNHKFGVAYQAHLVCAALRGGEVYLARVGACQGFLQQSGEVSAFPPDLSALESTPLGLRSRPPIALNRYTVAPGDVLILTDKTVAATDGAKRDAALRAAGAAELVAALKPLVVHAAQKSAMAMAAQLLAPEQIAETVERKEAVKPEASHAVGTGLTARLPKVDVDLRGGLHALKRNLALGVALLAALANRLLDQFFPEPADDDASGAPVSTSLAAGLTIFIALVVGVVMVGLFLRNTGRDRCDDFIRLTEEETAQAKELTGHNTEAREAWLAVKVHLEQALEVCPLSDPRPAQALEEARGFIDEYDQVVRPRPPVTQLRSYPSGALLHGPVIHAPDIYVLDMTNVAIYRDQLTESGVQVVEANTKPVLGKGDTVDGYVIERLVDIEWMAQGPVRSRSVIVTLEPTQGVMIAYSPTLLPTATLLVGREAWVEPIAITAWGGNFYILDAGADQIWRYRIAPGTGDYTDPPERYFDTLVTNPDLAGAIDLAIDDQGNVYILFDDGHVDKYIGGEAQSFSLDTLPVPPVEMRAMYMQSNARAQSLYLVDVGNESIFETTLLGKFAYHFRAANEEAFEDLRGVCVYSGPEGDSVYVLANNGLYHFNKPGMAQ